MTQKCANCGALLPPAEPGAYHLRCHYCQLDQEVAAQPAPAPAAPPPVMPAPPPFGAPPLRVVPPAPSGALGIVIAAIVSLVAVGAVVPLLVLGGGRGRSSSSRSITIGGMEQQKLARIALDTTPEKLEAITGVGGGADHRMRVPLSGSRFDAVTFNWDKDNLGHVSEIYLNLSGSQPEDEQVRKKLHELLGRRFEKGEQFQWQGCHLYFSPNGGVLSIGVNIAIGSEKNANWKPQIEALWDVVRQAIGVSVPVDAARIKGYLGLGYPLATLAKVDPAVDIDRSHSALARLFPGVISKPFIDLDHTVALDHPAFGEADLSWKNKAGSRLATVSLRPPPGLDKLANQREIEACVEGAFGRPYRRSTTDHLRGTWDTTWHPDGGGEVRVYQHMVTISLTDNPFAGDMPRPTWLKAVATLDACGRR